MARQLWATQLKNSRTSEEQIAILKNIKNEIVGHPLKKESAVRQGILDLVVRLTYNKLGWSKDSKAHDHTFAPMRLNEEEIVRLQGLQILASIALGEVCEYPGYISLTVCRRSFSSTAIAGNIRSTFTTFESMPFKQSIANCPCVSTGHFESCRLSVTRLSCQFY
jgi:hypothetical protein